MKKKIKISKKELRKLLDENEHLQNQVTELQVRGSEMLAQIREQAAIIRDLEAQLFDEQPSDGSKDHTKTIEEDIINSLRDYEPPVIPSPDLGPNGPFISPDIYYDSAFKR